MCITLTAGSKLSNKFARTVYAGNYPRLHLTHDSDHELLTSQGEVSLYG